MKMKQINVDFETIKSVNFKPLIEINKNVPNFQLEPLLVLFFEFLAKKTIHNIGFKNLKRSEKSFELLINPALFEALSENTSINVLIKSKLKGSKTSFDVNYPIDSIQNGIVFFLDAFYSYDYQKEMVDSVKWITTHVKYIQGPFKEKARLEKSISEPSISLENVKPKKQKI
jgi:hypothetical protein